MHALTVTLFYNIYCDQIIFEKNSELAWPSDN